VRADLTRRFAALARALLARHHPLSALRSPVFGIWAVPFKTRRQEIEADEIEQIESIAAAGGELGRTVLEEELGSATALHAGLDAGVVEIEGAGLDPSRWAKRLGSLPPRKRTPEGGSEEERGGLLALVEGRLDIRLQSLVSLKTLSRVGFEALARGPAGGPWHEPDRLFEAAALCGLRTEVEIACLESALELVRRLPASCRLAINLSPGLFRTPAVRRLAGEPRLPERLIFEITEHLPIPRPEVLLEETRLLRRRGAQIALDDAGCGYLNMDLVRALKPDIVKLCITVTRRIGASPATLDSVRGTVASIQAEGAQVLAEGIESAAQMRLAIDCGCALAQGFYFDKPMAVSELVAGRMLPAWKAELSRL